MVKMYLEVTEESKVRKEIWDAKVLEDTQDTKEQEDPEE